MSKKRTADESSRPSRERTDEGSNFVFQQESGAKHLRMIAESDTTLQDLPMELLEIILLKVVVTEVREMKLVKCVWNEKADLVISRLRSVCSLWSSVLTTNFFLMKVHRILDNIAQGTIRLEILLQTQLPLSITRVASMKDEVFMLYNPENMDSSINIHDRNNMIEIKEVIPLPGLHPLEMVACSVSDCLYVLVKGVHCYSVLRITRDEQQQFTISPWIDDLSLLVYDVLLFTSFSGNLIILSRQIRPSPAVLRIYHATGFFKQELILSPAIHGFKIIFSIIENANGSLVLGTLSDDLEVVLKEMDTNGRIVGLRQYESSTYGDSGVSVADNYGRIVIFGQNNQSDLVDSELNLMIVTAPRPRDHDFNIPLGVRYNKERSEIFRLYEVHRMNPFNCLTVFRFTEE